MARFLILALPLLMIGSLVRAQESADFFVKAYSTLLEVRVLDQSGKPVEGLDRSAFQVDVDSRPRPLLYFEERKNSDVSLVILVDIGSSMNREALGTAKEAIFELIHLLDPADEIAIAVYDRETEFLSGLTTNRIQLLEATRNIPVEGRTGFWERLSSAFGTSAMTGPAVDEALLRLKHARNDIRIVLTFSSAFGNLGRGTQEHLALAGARFFGVGWSNRLGNAFNLWGDRMSRGSILRRSGGAQYSGKEIEERIEFLADALQSFYLLAYDPLPDEEDEGREPEVRIPGRPELKVTFLRRVETDNPFY